MNKISAINYKLFTNYYGVQRFKTVFLRAENILTLILEHGKSYCDFSTDSQSKHTPVNSIIAKTLVDEKEYPFEILPIYTSPKIFFTKQSQFTCKIDEANGRFSEEKNLWFEKNKTDEAVMRFTFAFMNCDKKSLIKSCVQFVNTKCIGKTVDDEIQEILQDKTKNPEKKKEEIGSLIKENLFLPNTIEYRQKAAIHLTPNKIELQTKSDAEFSIENPVLYGKEINDIIYRLTFQEKPWFECDEKFFGMVTEELIKSKEATKQVFYSSFSISEIWYKDINQFTISKALRALVMI